MKRYPQYKESGVSWIGQVPAHWTLARYKHILAEKAAIKDSQLSPGAISHGKVVYKDGDLLYGPTKASYQEVQSGDFLVNPINLNYDLKSLRTALSEINVCVSPAYIVLKSIIAADLNYLKHQLYLFDVSHMKTLGAGVRQTISYNDIGNCWTVIPPESEQASISSYLEKELEKIDLAITSQEKLVHLLRERVDALVLSAISGVGVKHSRLENVAEIISRPVGSTPSRSYTKLGLYNRGRGIFHKDESDADDMGDSEFYYIHPGDLIISGQFAWEGAVAMAGAEEDMCVVSHRYPVLRGISSRAMTEYLLAFLCTEYGTFILNEHSHGAAGRNKPLNINSLLKEKIPIPDIVSQMNVVKAVRQRRLILEHIARLNLILKERRTAIITQAVTGQIDVR